MYLIFHFSTQKLYRDRIKILIRKYVKYSATHSYVPFKDKIQLLYTCNLYSKYLEKYNLVHILYESAKNKLKLKFSKKSSFASLLYCNKYEIK